MPPNTSLHDLELTLTSEEWSRVYDLYLQLYQQYDVDDASVDDMMERVRSIMMYQIDHVTRGQPSTSDSVTVVMDAMLATAERLNRKHLEPCNGDEERSSRRLRAMFVQVDRWIADCRARTVDDDDESEEFENGVTDGDSYDDDWPEEYFTDGYNKSRPELVLGVMAEVGVDIPIELSRESANALVAGMRALRLRLRR